MNREVVGVVSQKSEYSVTLRDKGVYPLSAALSAGERSLLEGEVRLLLNGNSVVSGVIPEHTASRANPPLEPDAYTEDDLMPNMFCREHALSEAVKWHIARADQLEGIGDVLLTAKLFEQYLVTGR